MPTAPPLVLAKRSLADHGLPALAEIKSHAKNRNGSPPRRSQARCRCALIGGGEAIAIAVERAVR